MRLWITRQMLKLVVKWVDIPEAPAADIKTERWLAESWLNEAVKQYFSSRERKLKEFLTDPKLFEDDKFQKHYAIAYGQLLEVKLFRHHMESCYNSFQKRMKETKNPSPSNAVLTARTP